MRTSEDNQKGCVKEPMQLCCRYDWILVRNILHCSCLSDKKSVKKNYCLLKCGDVTSRTGLVGTHPPSGVWVLETDDLILITSLQLQVLFTFLVVELILGCCHGKVHLQCLSLLPRSRNWLLL